MVINSFMDKHNINNYQKQKAEYLSYVKIILYIHNFISFTSINETDRKIAVIIVPSMGIFTVWAKVSGLVKKGVITPPVNHATETRFKNSDNTLPCPTVSLSIGGETDLLMMTSFV